MLFITMDPAQVFGIVSTLLSIYIISFIILLILENRDPEKTVAWILIVFFFPIIGLIAYFYLGQNWKKKKFMRYFHTGILKTFFKKRAQYAQDLEASTQFLAQQVQQKTAQVINHSTWFELSLNNNFTLYSDGKRLHEELIKQLRAAKKFIHIEYYRVRNDQYGHEIRDVLIEKAQQGVEVRVMLDFYGSLSFILKNQALMRRKGIISYSFFNPLRLFAHHKANYRTHRKIVVVDGKYGFIGGMNIGEEYITGGKHFHSWHDAHAFVEGTIVHQLETIFLYDWYLNRKENIITKDYFPHIKLKNKKQTPMQVVYGGPESREDVIKQTYFTMISNARKNITITTPYLIPDESILIALKNAAMSGITVKIIMPAVHDHLVPFHASRTYFEELLQAGVQIYEFSKGFMHAKIVEVDGLIASVGTANFDVRSFNMNFECNLILYGKNEVGEVQKLVEEMIPLSRQIHLETFKRRSILRKMKQSFFRLFSPVL